MKKENEKKTLKILKNINRKKKNEDKENEKGNK